MAKRIHSLCAVLLTLMLLIAPARVYAAPLDQDGVLDPATLTAIEDAAAMVFGATGTSGALGTVGLPDDEPVDEPIDEPVAVLSVLDVSELVTHEWDDFTVQLPAAWTIADDDTSRTLGVDDRSGFSMQIENIGDEAPGLLFIPIFEGQIVNMAAEFGDDVEMLPPVRFTSADGLPGLRIGFLNADDQSLGFVDGAIYLIPTGVSAIGVYAVAPPAIWSQIETTVEDAVLGMVIAPEIIGIQMAGDEPLTLVAPDERFSLELPAGWYGNTTNDEQLSLVIADPEIKVVGAGGIAVTADPNDETLTALTEAIAGALSPEEGAVLVAAILEQLDMGEQEEVTIDEEMTTVFPSKLEDVLGIIRIVGEAPLADFGAMPITLYLSVYTDMVGTFVFFGEVDNVLALEETILGIMDTLTVLE